MRSKLIGFTLFLVWATAVLGAYYVFHKPIDALNLHALITSAGSLMAALALVTASVGLGRLVLRWRSIAADDGFAQLSMAFGVGFGLLGLFWLGLASVGLLVTWAAWLVLLGFGVVLSREWLAWWRGFFQAVRSNTPKAKAHRLIAVFVILLAAMSLLNALAPPHAWDALMYHLASPARHIQAGRLVVEPSLPESGYPQLVEMHYTWLLLLGAPHAAAVLHWLIGIMSSLLVFDLARRWINDQAAWLAVAILFSAGTWNTLMGIAYIDLVLVFYATVAFMNLVEWIDQPSIRHTLLLGVLAGFAFGVKYTGAFVGLSLVILMVWRSPRRSLRTMLYFGPAALAVAAPWLLKNLPAGNPFYPFFWQGEGWDSIRQAWFSRLGTGLLDTNPSRLLTAPILMTILGADGAKPWDASFGPILLMLTPLLFIGWRAHREKTWFRYGLAWVGLLYIAWLVGAANSSLLIIPRLIFPLIPVLVILLGASALRLFDLDFNRVSLGRITLVLILLVLVLSVFSQLGEVLENQSLEVALGWISSEDYLYHRLGWYHGAIRYLEALPHDSRVLFLFEPRTFYCPPSMCIPDGILDRWHWYRQRGFSALDLMDEWRNQGVTHVLIYQLGVDLLQAGDDPLTEPDWDALDQLIQNYLVEVENFGDVYALYQLPASPGAP
jgi:hypothetical protein